ncbi:hypothetical protein MRBLWH7_000046 [Microbacterium sp. LWH7-1.2]|jgi:hypothetical protein|uniref:hypothetical protein n=1 Tax=Microbacterium sp. LWH7-1.2 TaxID=3135257 RepID=UPI00313A216C
MDNSTATVLAAIITGAVVAVTFLAAEIIRFVRDRSDRRTAAVARALSALDQVPDMVLRDFARWIPFSSLRHKPTMGPLTEIVASTLSLYAVMKGRDRAVAHWAAWMVEAVSTAQGEHRVVLASELQGVLLAYLMDRRKARAFVARAKPEVDAWRERVMDRGGPLPLGD